MCNSHRSARAGSLSHDPQIIPNPSHGCGSRRALIQFSSDLNETRCKSFGRGARFFCAYFQRAGGKRELTPYDCRSRGFRWPCPPQRHWPLVRPPFARTRAAKWHFRCAVVGCHLPPPSPHPTCAVWWCVWGLFAPVTPEAPQIHLDSEIAWLVLALAQLGRSVPRRCSTEHD